MGADRCGTERHKKDEGGGRWRWGEEKGGGGVLRLKSFRFGITYIYIDFCCFVFV